MTQEKRQKEAGVEESGEFSCANEGMEDIGQSSEVLPESCDDVDASYTSGFLSDLESDGDEDDANSEGTGGGSHSGGGGVVDSGGNSRNKDIGGNDGGDEVE